MRSKNNEFWFDIKIFFKTFLKVFKKEGISEHGMETSQNLGIIY